MNYIRRAQELGVKGILYSLSHSKLDVCIRKVIQILTKESPLCDAIVIESHNDFDCNGGTFYEYLIRNGFNKKYKIIWLLKNKAPKQLPDNVRCYGLYSPSIMKNYYICCAKYLLADCMVTDKIRKDQISIYCTHGSCTFKNVKNLLVIPPSVDYILSGSKRYDPIVCENFSIPYPNNRMIHLGYPSNDVLFCHSQSDLKKITAKEYRKVVLWMPTFRKSFQNRNDSNGELPLGIPLIKDNYQLGQLNHFLKENDCLLLIKIHPAQDLNTIVELRSMSNILVIDNNMVKKLRLDSYRLMADADALISDYSSSAYSFLILNRPIAFVLADLADYKLGFCVENIDDFLPGPKIYCYSELVDFITTVINERDDYVQCRIDLRNWLYEHIDGHSCERLASFMELEK